METIATKKSAKNLFNLVHKIGETVIPNGKYGIYLKDVDDGIRYRVDCGDFGSFEIDKRFSSEDYNVLTGEWETQSGEWYMFMSAHEFDDQYPEMTIETAFEILK